MSKAQENDSLALLEWINIPEGKVKLFNDELIEVDSFKIAKYPVTNEQFSVFVEANGYKASEFWEGLAVTPRSPRKSDWPENDAPKLQVAWFEAVAFCRWLSVETQSTIRLAKEWEWQWAAVGESGLDFAFGQFSAELCNTKERKLERSNPVTRFDKLETHFGTVDMAGNVWEWCLNEGHKIHNCQVTGSESRVLKGGSWNNPSGHGKASYRIHRNPRSRTFNIGFRILKEL